MDKKIEQKDFFKTRVCSDLDYEGMVVDIVYKNSTVATLNQDKGIKNTEIKVFPPVDKDCWDFPYEEFIKILKKAKETLIKFNQER